jgi:hypothetical protein
LAVDLRAVDLRVVDFAADFRVDDFAALARFAVVFLDLPAIVCPR